MGQHSSGLICAPTWSLDNLIIIPDLKHRYGSVSEPLWMIVWGFVSPQKCFHALVSIGAIYENERVWEKIMLTGSITVWDHVTGEEE